MSNSEKYNFSDFTLTEYAKLIDLAKQNYIFRSFHDFDKKERFIIWRHDVDMTMHTAVKMAKIEHSKGIKAIYFILIHSEFYNVFEKEITDCIKQIIELGHYIGLHFDSHYYGIQNENDLEKYIEREKKLMEDYFGQKLFAFSFHNTNDFIMSCQKWSYGGLINTYATYFQKEVKYCSDSNGYWRFRRLHDVLEKAEDYNLQALTHPVWWQEEIMSPRQKIMRALNGRTEKHIKSYDTLLVNMGRENIDW